MDCARLKRILSNRSYNLLWQRSAICKIRAACEPRLEQIKMFLAVRHGITM